MVIGKLVVASGVDDVDSKVLAVVSVVVVMLSAVVCVVLTIVVEMVVAIVLVSPPYLFTINTAKSKFLIK